MKDKYEFNQQELEDLWSSLTVWERIIDKKQSPQTTKDIRRLIKKIKRYLGHKSI